MEMGFAPQEQRFIFAGFLSNKNKYYEATMQELSMNILDIAQNSVRAGAAHCRIELHENTAENTLRLAIIDDGCGMDEETVARVADPFFTSRTTRKVGLGLPFLQMAAQMAGGQLTIQSQPGHGTTVQAWFALNHIDLMPLGNMGATMATLCAGSPQVEFGLLYEHNGHRFLLETQQMRALLGEVSFSQPEVVLFITDYVNEQMDAVRMGKSSAPDEPKQCGAH